MFRKPDHQRSLLLQNPCPASSAAAEAACAVEGPPNAQICPTRARRTNATRYDMCNYINILPLHFSTSWIPDLGLKSPAAILADSLEHCSQHFRGSLFPALKAFRLALNHSLRWRGLLFEVLLNANLPAGLLLGLIAVPCGASGELEKCIQY